MPFVEESDIGVYGLRVWNEHGKFQVSFLKQVKTFSKFLHFLSGESYCEARLIYDGLEVYPGQSLGDLYQGFEKYTIAGLPMPLPDKPLITQVCITSIIVNLTTE